MEIEHLQIFEVVGLAHCLEQHGAQTAVIIHRTAAVHEQQYFDGVFPGTVVNHFQFPCVVTGFSNGAVNVKFCFGFLSLGGKLPQSAESHLELTSIQCVILTEITEFPFAGNLKSTAFAAFPANTDASGAEAAVAEYRNAAGAYPVTAAVVFFLLFFQSFQKHFLDFRLRNPFILHGTLHVELVAGFFLGICEPVHQFRRQLPFKFHAFEKFQKGAVEFVKIRFAFHQHTAAQIVKSCERGLVQTFVQSFHKGHPFIHGYFQPSGAQ